MLRIVLPIISSLTAVDVILPVVIKVVAVDVDIAVSPTTAIAPAPAPSCSHGHAHSKRKKHPRHIARVGIGGIRVRRGAVDHNGVVRGDINHVGLSLLNDDDLLAPLNLLILHFLLRGGF